MIRETFVNLFSASLRRLILPVGHIKVSIPLGYSIQAQSLKIKLCRPHEALDAQYRQPSTSIHLIDSSIFQTGSYSQTRERYLITNLPLYNADNRFRKFDPSFRPCYLLQREPMCAIIFKISPPTSFSCPHSSPFSRPVLGLSPRDPIFAFRSPIPISDCTQISSSPPPHLLPLCRRLKS